MKPLNVARDIVAAFYQRRAEESQEDALKASELVAEMQQLADYAPFQRLLAELGPAHDAVYDRWLEGQPVAPEAQAFARLVRLLRTRPLALVEQARLILNDSRSV